MSLGPYVGGHGPSNATLMVVGIAPGAQEEVDGIPLTGPSGKILDGDLRDAGSSIHEVYRTNIFKYKLPNNEFKRHQEIGLALPDAIADLQEEINAVNPNCILGLGDPVLYALTGHQGKKNGINVWRGSILQYQGIKTIFTWHPAHELHSLSEDTAGAYKPWQRYIRKFDVNRAVEQSKFKEFRLPQRLLRVAKSSSDLYRFLEQNENEKECALDIESKESIPICVGLSFHPSEGFTIPLWNTLPIRCLNEKHPKKSYNRNTVISTIPTGDLAYIWKWLAEFLLDKRYKFIGQNFKYDEDKLNALGFYLHSLYWDTMIGAHCRSPELLKSLAFNTSIDTEEPFYKNEGMYEGKIEDLLIGCARDACVTREIKIVQERDLKEIPYGIEHVTWRNKLHKAYLEIDRVGFRIDEIERKNLIHKYVQWLVKLEVELHELLKGYGITEFININSHPRVNKLLYEDLKIPRRKGAGEQEITALIGNVLKDKKLIKICEIILEWRRVDKTLGYLKAEPDYDGRMRTTFKITGTENYRTSTNILEPPIRPTKVGWSLQTVSKHGDIGNDLRSILVADPNYVLVNIDQGQAEARVCSLLADDEETLLSYDKGDKHALTASKFFGGKEENYSKKILGFECPERFVGKTLRHAYHLDIGKREAMINVNTDARKYKIPITISEWRAGECLKVLERDTPKIKTVFHYTIQELLHKDRRIVGTYGASRYFYDEMNTRDLWKGAYSFIPQQTVSDKTKQVILKTHKNLWHVKIACESHDALAFLIPMSGSFDDTILELQSYFMEPISFANCSIPRRDLVIPCDIEIGIDYCDLRKYQRAA